MAEAPDSRVERLGIEDHNGTLRGEPAPSLTRVDHHRRAGFYAGPVTVSHNNNVGVVLVVIAYLLNIMGHDDRPSSDLEGVRAGMDLCTQLAEPVPLTIVVAVNAQDLLARQSSILHLLVTLIHTSLTWSWKLSVRSSMMPKNFGFFSFPPLQRASSYPGA